MTDPVNAMAESMAQFTDVLTPVRETVLGYRRCLIEAGVDALTADSMAADAHHLILTVIGANMVKS